MQPVKLMILLAVLVSPYMAVAQEAKPPQDSKKYYMYVFTHSDWQNRPDESLLMSNLSQKPMLDLKNKCHFNHYTEAEPVYVTGRYWNVPVEKFPAIILADSSGAYFYASYKDHIPSTSQGIFDDAKKFYAINKDAHLTPAAPQPVVDEPIVDEPRQPLMPNAPWNRTPEDDFDIGGLFGPGTPILDGVRWTGWIFTGLMAIFAMFMLICIAAPFGIMALYLFSKLFK